MKLNKQEEKLMPIKTTVLMINGRLQNRGVEKILEKGYHVDTTLGDTLVELQRLCMALTLHTKSSFE